MVTGTSGVDETVADQAAKQQNLTTTQMLSTSPYVIQLNTMIPPFDDQKARDAIYYATDTEAIRKGLEKASTENTVRLAIEQGMSTVEAFRKYGVM